LSWKIWDQGEVVEAGDFQEYIQNQVVQSYPSASARSTTLGTAVAEGMISYREDANVVEVYDGSSWVGIGTEGDITGVTAGTALTGGGTTGDVTLNADIAAIGSAVVIEVSQVTDITASATEINLLDGVTATTAEINYIDGVTSNLQTQLDGKVDESDGSVTQATAGSAVVRNITLSTATPGTADGSDGDVWLVYTP